MITRICDRCGCRMEPNYSVIPMTYAVPAPAFEAYLFLMCDDFEGKNRPIDLCNECSREVRKFALNLYEEEEK